MFKVLLVGAGAMGRAWGRNLKANPDTSIAAWIDIRSEAAAEAAAGLELNSVYTGSDLGMAIADVKPDFVVDVTIPEAHHDVTLTALTMGVPVLGEKPMAVSMEQARAMVAASEKADKLYMVSQSRRYDGRIHAYKQLIQQQVGNPELLKSDFYIGAHFGGFRDEMAHVLLLDMAIHTFDAARFLTDADPISVYCEEYNPSWSWYQRDASANALFEMSGGLRYLYSGSWCSEGCLTSWEAQWRAVGPQGSALWDGDSAITAEHVVGSQGFTRETEASSAEAISMDAGITGSLQDFLHALRTNTTPMGECHDNIKSLAMVFSAVESSETGQRVKVVI